VFSPFFLQKIIVFFAKKGIKRHLGDFKTKSRDFFEEFRLLAHIKGNRREAGFFSRLATIF
jgi:hypothetical protein